MGNLEQGIKSYLNIGINPAQIQQCHCSQNYGTTWHPTGHETESAIKAVSSVTILLPARFWRQLHYAKQKTFWKKRARKPLQLDISAEDFVSQPQEDFCFPVRTQSRICDTNGKQKPGL